MFFVTDGAPKFDDGSNRIMGLYQRIQRPWDLFKYPMILGELRSQG